jgi:hypothetical protein
LDAFPPRLVRGKAIFVCDAKCCDAFFSTGFVPAPYRSHLPKLASLPFRIHGKVV